MDIFSNDDAVIATNDDASSCKRCAVSLGYWHDPYIQYFIRSCERRAPEINRGYFARVLSIMHLVEKFIDVTNGKCQLINIGSGFDTLYWRLKDHKKNIQNFVELDFPGVTSKKCMYIQRNKILLQGISHEDHDVKLNRSNLHGYNYKLNGVDLRNLTQVGLNDRFGEVMLKNLRSRGCDLQGSEACSTLETQQDRFINEGWLGAESLNMGTVWSRLPPEDIARVTRLEMLDEQELLQQLFSHYCLTTAWTDSRWGDIQL